MTKKTSSPVLFCRGLVLGCTFLFAQGILTGPQGNKFDPQSDGSMLGKDMFPALYDEETRGSWNFAFDTSVYYQDANSGRNWAGRDVTSKNPTIALSETNANDPNRIEVGIFEERGPWNMLGIFYGISEELFNSGLPPQVATANDNFAGISPIDFLPLGYRFKPLRPVGTTVSVTTATPSLGGSKIKALVGGASNWTYAKYHHIVDTLHLIAFSPVGGEVSTIPSHVFNSDDGLAYRVADTAGSPAIPGSVVSPLYRKAFAPDDVKFEEENYEKQVLGFYRPQIEFKRQGVRGKVSMTFMPGFKIWAKGGICEYKTQPIPFSREAVIYRSGNMLTRAPRKISSKKNSDEHKKIETEEDARDIMEQYQSIPMDMPEVKVFATGGTVNSPSETEVLKTCLLNSTVMKQVLDELNFNIEGVREWSFEDSYIAADFAYPFTFRGNDGKDVLKLWPVVSVGAWLPTSRKPDPLKPIYLFRVPVGNDEHMGLSIDGALNFDFKNSITVNVGLGATLFNKKTFHNFPIKIHPKQHGILPWQVSVERKLGDTFTAHASMAANNFIDGLSAYIEYSFTSHQADQLTMLNADIKKLQDEDIDMKMAFKEQMDETAWSTQELHAGLLYQVTQNIALGAAFKAHVKGDSVPKVKTVMINMKIAF